MTDEWTGCNSEPEVTKGLACLPDIRPTDRPAAWMDTRDGLWKIPGLRSQGQ